MPGAWALLPGLHLAIALFAGRLAALGAGAGRGYRRCPVVAARDADAALLRLLDLRPELLVAGRPAPGAA